MSGYDDKPVFSVLADAVGLRWNPGGDASGMPSQVLAYMGDAVYEVYVRMRLLAEGPARPGRLHMRAVSGVCADAQAKALEKVMQELTQEEQMVVRRGRNVHTHRHKKGCAAYAHSTAFEALLGYLFLKGDMARLCEIMSRAYTQTYDDI